MVSNQFALMLSARVLLVFCSLAVTAVLLTLPGYQVSTLIALLVTALLTAEVYRFVSRTNQELSRFLDAVQYEDFGQRFRFSKLGAGFETLGETFTTIMDQLREERRENEQALRHLRALLEHVPVPLVSIYADDSLTLWNHSARRLFGNAHPARVSDLTQFGDEFAGNITTLSPGQRVVTVCNIDGREQHMMISASEITIANRSERLVSLQNIQSELDSMQQSAWQDLVRVLTHEIMNSITPIASLARTAADLLDDARTQISGQSGVAAELQDAFDAVTTVARRSDGLMSFVANYRQLARAPAPSRVRFVIADLLRDVIRITGQERADVSFEVLVEPAQLELVADKQLVEQVLINLVQNATQSLSDGGIIWFSARLSVRGHVMIEVADNGPGITDDVASRMFVPFYTTRREGSGVGLALSRQIMVAHGGTIAFSHREGGGARFVLVF